MATLVMPTISIITCSLNPDLMIFTKCLNALKKQKYPKILLEHIVMDGGSTNGGDILAEEFGCKVIRRPDLKNFALQRMSLGITLSKGSIILILEPDNIILGKNWIEEMIQPFREDENVIGTFSIYNSFENKMPILTKYYSLFGVNDTLLHYLGKSEKIPQYQKSYNKGRLISRNSNYSVVEFDKNNFPTLGDNGHMVRKKIIQQVNKNSKLFLHTDAFYDLLDLGYNKYGAVNNSIIHYTGSSIISSFKKRIEYKNRFKKYNRTYLVFNPLSGRDVLKVVLFGLYAITIVQPLFESCRGYIKKKEIAWFLHPIMCLGTFLTYLISFFRQWI